MDTISRVELTGRRVLVTGGSAGIGAAVVRACADAGADVASLSRTPHGQWSAEAGTRVVELAADVRDEDQVAEAVRRAEDELGGLDAVVNSAGMQRPGGVEATSYADWAPMFETNVLGLLNVTKAAIAALRRAGGGDVVNVSSMGGRRVNSVESGVYSGTKFAVHAISEALRRELWSDGIRVGLVAPGSVNTGFGSKDAPPDQRERIIAHKARIGLDPRDVAWQVLNVIGAPPDVTIHEIAMTSMRQEPR